LPIKEAAGRTGAHITPEKETVPAEVIEKPPMTFSQIYKGVLSRKDTNKKSAVYTTVTEILGGYKDDSEARDDAKELRKTGGRRYSAWGYEIGPETIERALKVKSKLHPSGMDKKTAEGFLSNIRHRVQEYYDKGHTRDIPRGGISAELVRHEYAPVGGNQEWWLEQVKQIISDEQTVQDEANRLRESATTETISESDVSPAENAAIHAWYDAHPESDKLNRKPASRKPPRKKTYYRRPGRTETGMKGLR
jgi:hypothetical protein